MGKAIDPHHIIEALHVTYTKQGVWIWLNSPNSNLGGERPIELLANGKQERVVWAIERIGDAVFPAPGARDEENTR